MAHKPNTEGVVSRGHSAPLGDCQIPSQEPRAQLPGAHGSYCFQHFSGGQYSDFGSGFGWFLETCYYLSE